MSVRNCPRCNGSMFMEDCVLERDWVCLQCGNRMEVTEQNVFGRPTLGTRREDVVHARRKRVSDRSLAKRRPQSVGKPAHRDRKDLGEPVGSLESASSLASVARGTSRVPRKEDSNADTPATW